MDRPDLNQSTPSKSLQVLNSTSYTSLNPQLEEIRLICLAPATQLEDTLVLGLITVSLLHLPLKYEALSWAWEGDDRSHEAIIDGHRSYINRNLASALRRIRVSHKTVILWADAICINQNDLVERSTQILLMRRTYTLASSVVVWLGESDQETATVVEVFRTIQQGGHIHHIRLKDGGTLMNHLEKFTAFFARSWFSRCWVVQELTLAQNSYFRCGEYTIPFEDLDRFSHVIQQQSIRIATEIREIFAEKARQFAIMMRQIKSFNIVRPCYTHKRAVVSEHGNGTGKTLDEWFLLLQYMIMCRDRETTDPRDKIYAFLGLLPDVRTVLFQPTYEVPWQQVYKEFAALIASNGLIEPLLSQAGLSQRDLSFPSSWIPNWKGPSVHAMMTWLLGRRTGPFAASRAVWPSSTIRDNGLLILEGAVLDCLAKTGKSIPLDDEVEQECLVRWCDWIDFVNVNFKPDKQTPYILGSTLQEAFLRAMILDTAPYHFQGAAASRANSSDIVDLLKLLDQYIGPLTAFLAPGDFQVKNNENSPLRSQDVSSLLKNVGGGLIHNITLSRIAMTHYGCIGFFPRLAQAGDVICVLASFTRPVLLRPVRAKFLHDVEVAFQLVGFCYVHGIMDLKAGPAEDGQMEADFDQILRTTSHPRTAAVIRDWKSREWKHIHII